MFVLLSVNVEAQSFWQKAQQMMQQYLPAVEQPVAVNQGTDITAGLKEALRVGSQNDYQVKMLNFFPVNR